MSERPPATENPWQQLRQLTPARIALGRAGTSLPTRAQLDFQFAHAQARDAVHLPFDPKPLSDALQQRGLDTLHLRSAADDRHTYLQRPDLGRRLHADSGAQLDDYAAQHGTGKDLAIVIADGLSSLAVHRHSLPFLERLLEQVTTEGWSLARLDKPMKAILRAGTYELLARPDVPAATVISEYIDVAHAFFDKRETGFVNGLLDAIAKTARG